MNKDETTPKLHLIRKPRRMPPSEEQFIEHASQSLLFPMPKRDLLIFIVFPSVGEEEFTRTLELARPVAILELRRSPRFDMGRLNRQLAFRWFEATHSKYYDLSSMLSREERSAADPIHLVESFLRKSGNQVMGPVMILISEAYNEGNKNNIFRDIVNLFVSVSKHPWEMVEIPRFA